MKKQILKSLKVHLFIIDGVPVTLAHLVFCLLFLIWQATTI